MTTAISTEVLTIGRIDCTTALAIAVDVLEYSRIPADQQKAAEQADLDWLLNDEMYDPFENAAKLLEMDHGAGVIHECAESMRW